MFQKDHKHFQAICAANGLTLSYAYNKQTLYLLKSIFEDREYADFFPFYESAIIVDVGAHYGYFSIFAHLNSDKSSRIFAIEPDPTNFTLLQKNLFDQRIENVKSLNVAVSAEVGETSLYLGNSVNSSLIANYALNEVKADSIPVRTSTLAQIIVEEKLSRIDFLKLDCEGAEYAILLDADSVAFENVTTISMEFHDLKDARFTGNVLSEKLVKMGFRIVKFHYEKTTRGLNFGKIIATRLL